MKYGILFVLLITLLAASTIQAAGPLLEVTSDGKAIQGCQVFHDSRSCLLMQQDGKLVNVPFQSVTDFKVKAPEFRPWSGMELRSQLRKEFGRGYEIKGSERYLIVAPEGKAGPYADLFDQVYREFWSYFSVRQFAIDEPEFPLVAIVFPNQAEFASYAARDGIRNTQGLAGYYERMTNRVALFDKEGDVAINIDSSLSSFTGLAALDPTLRDTIIHEATHQVAFNTGLHSRWGQTPKWVVEGLATVFENDLMRGTSRHSTVLARVNRERYVWFGNYSQKRRKEGNLTLLVHGDQPFQRNVLDAYAESWALSFYLMESRSSQYAQYLQKITARAQEEQYSAADRLKDFEAAFGQSASQIERDFLRYYADLK